MIVLTSNFLRRLRPAAVARGTFWAAVDNWTQQFLQLASFLFIGNLIGPQALGTMAMALVYTVLIQILLMNSFTDVLVQRRDLVREHWDATFWSIFGAGIVAGVISVGAAPLVALAFHEPQVREIIWALSITFAFMGASAFYESRLRRELAFRMLAIRTLIAGGLAVATGLFCVSMGFGVWSLVAYHLVWRTSECLVLALISRWLPRLTFSGVHLRELLDYGLHSVGARFIGYLGHNVDRVAVGMFLGAHALGLYAMALRAVEALTQALSGVFQGVALPLFARLQDRPRRLAEAISEAVELSTAIGLPAFVGLALVGRWAVEAVLEPQWAPLVPILMLLCVVGAVTTVSYFLGAGMRATGRADVAFRMTALALVLRLIAVGFTIRHGAVAVAAGQVAVTLLLQPIWLWLMHRAIGFDVLGLVLRLWPAGLGSLIMAVALLGFERLIDPNTAPALVLTAMVLLGVLAYAVVYGLSSRSGPQLAARFLRARVPDA